MHNAGSLLILLFFSITWLQSGFEKISCYAANLSWLKKHFEATFLQPFFPLALWLLILFEITSGLLCVAGIVELLINEGRFFGFNGAILSAITLIVLLFGQRIAKDYDGARTICLYFIPAILAVHWLS